MKTYLVPVTDEMIKAMEKGEAPSFLHCATCLDNLTNGEVAERVFDVAFSHVYLEDLVDGFGYESNDECLICDHNWFDRKWGE